MDLGAYNSYMEIDLGAIELSFNRVKDFVGEHVSILPVLKGNAYGHGTVKIAEFYRNKLGCRALAVSQLVEALKIREAGMTDVDILVMGSLLPRQMGYAVDHDVQFALFTIEDAEALSAIAAQKGKTARVQIKVETGMNRIGVAPGPGLDALLDRIAALKNIEITGFFTHYATSTTVDDPFVEQQYAAFAAALSQAENKKIKLKYVHTCNTGAVSWFKKGYFSHVRLGCIIMGYPSMDDFSNPLNVVEPMSFRAFITHIHQIDKGESCGYDRHFKAEKPTTIATINIGYGDGLHRPLAQNGGPVIVNDTKTRYLATCLDQTMVDVTGIDCKPGDEVTIYGTSKGGTSISINELKGLTGQSFVYPMILISDRVKRTYTYNGGDVL